jgi:hypothetical protein
VRKTLQFIARPLVVYELSWESQTRHEWLDLTHDDIGAWETSPISFVYQI